jgi:hypothetical protein
MFAECDGVLAGKTYRTKMAGPGNPGGIKERPEQWKDSSRALLFERRKLLIYLRRL